MCARTDLPIAWTVRTARTHESSVVSDLLTTIKTRGFVPETAALDKGYDVKPVYDACEQSSWVAADHPAPSRPLPSSSGAQHLSPDVRAWHLDVRRSRLPAQADEMALPYRRMLAQEPLAEGQSRLHPLVPRETPRWRSLYRARAAVEREFGRLKHDYGLAPLRARGIERVALHADLVMLARLSQALARARAIPLAA